MDLLRLRDELVTDEGISYNIYLDHLGNPTFGIGHMGRSNEPEASCEVGARVSADRVNTVFEQDIESVLIGCIIK
jgi:GH24 family phage-related lysozyme (muramidase)